LKDFLVGRSRIRFYGWASLVTQILIVVTGGAVRLTGSGLGCPTWPECKPGSLVNVPELGIHGFIEFANRLLTFVLLIVAILTFLTVLLLDKGERKGKFWTSLALGLGIFAQAVIGGITVLTGLNSWVVGAHFVVSAALIVIATILLWHCYATKTVATSGLTRLASLALFPVGMVSIVLGVIVTGAGPHAGDSNTPRNGLDIDILAHLHSYPGYLMLILVVLQIILLKRNQMRIRTSIFLLITLIFQALIGITQTRLGLPIELVALHMFGAAVLCSLITWQQLYRGIWRSANA
jgi:heme a synthase